MSAYFNNSTQEAMDGNIPNTPPVIVAHAYSLVAFLIDRHGPRVLGEFIAQLAEEPDWRAVLRTTYNRAPGELTMRR